MKILVVDDEEIKRVSLVDDLISGEHQAFGAASGEEALRQLLRNKFDVVVADLRMPGIDGMELLKRIRQDDFPSPEVIIMTAYGSIPLAVEAMKIGAFDFVTKPFRNDEILRILTRIQSQKACLQATNVSPSEIDATGLKKQIVGDSSNMNEVRRMIRLCAQSEATVLLIGETGTGKDLVAKTIHTLSHRHEKSFIKVSCAAIPSQLIESELFGHTKGAFTGADQDTQGKFDAAEGGTLYLDDVDDIPLEQQIKLMQAIEEKEFERVGAIATVKVDVRIIAATKKNLLLEVKKGTFRSDLYYRLNVLRINLPPLRDRIDDLPALVDHHLNRITKGKPFSFDRNVMELLQSHHWPGNVRELAHTLERAYLVGNSDSFSELIASDLAGLPQSSFSESGSFRIAVEQTEQELLQQALRKANGNKSAAARSLGMKLSTFRDKLKRHHLM